MRHVVPMLTEVGVILSEPFLQDRATVLRDRLTLHEDASAKRDAVFAEDVGTGLRADPKRIPACHLYDDIGSALFEAITFLPEYYLTRVEAEILERNALAIMNAVGCPLEMIELGSGSGRKTRILIEAALRKQIRLEYKPIDISSGALVASATSLTVDYPDVIVNAFAGDYRKVLGSGALSTPRRSLTLFLGSSVGNYAQPQALELLRAVAVGGKPGDVLLLGVDLKKSHRELELAYNDLTGITACFNRNILGRINRELGGHFPLDSFRYIASYDALRGCVDSFQESKRAQTVRIDALDMEVTFAPDERIHTESSYKYDRDDLEALARESGFTLEKVWTDDLERYALALLIAG